MLSRAVWLFSCLFAIVISTLIVSQSGRAPITTETAHGLFVAQVPQTVTADRRGARPVKATAPMSGASQPSGLNFATAVTYDSGGLAPYSVAVADVNGDGKPDLLVANFCPSNSSGGCNNPAGVVAVLLGNGDGTFQTPVTYGAGGWETYSVAVADVNGDGKPDLLVASACASGGSDGCTSSVGAVGVLLGNGDGTFQTAVTYSSGGYEATSVAVADVNGVGRFFL